MIKCLKYCSRTIKKARGRFSLIPIISVGASQRRFIFGKVALATSKGDFSCFITKCTLIRNQKGPKATTDGQLPGERLNARSLGSIMDVLIRLQRSSAGVGPNNAKFWRQIVEISKLITDGRRCRFSYDGKLVPTHQCNDVYIGSI